MKKFSLRKFVLWVIILAFGFLAPGVLHADYIITTFAGTGSAGYNGDFFDATSAQLNNPAGVAIDSSGNVYIADYDNHRIRKVFR